MISLLKKPALLDSFRIGPSASMVVPSFSILSEMMAMAPLTAPTVATTK